VTERKPQEQRPQKHPDKVDKGAKTEPALKPNFAPNRPTGPTAPDTHPKPAAPPKPADPSTGKGS
jgi:hypothetical protein